MEIFLQTKNFGKFGSKYARIMLLNLKTDQHFLRKKWSNMLKKKIHLNIIWETKVSINLVQNTWIAVMKLKANYF